MVKKKGATPPKEETIKLWVLYSKSSTGGLAESSEPYSNRSDEYVTVHFKGAYTGDSAPAVDYSTDLKCFDIPKAAFDVPRSHVFLVVAYYQDGDTFGSSHGNPHLDSVYGNSEKAHAVASSLENDKDGPWTNYFARLEHVEVEILPVIGTTSGKDPKDLSDW